jgi:hypothetical protein
MMTRLCLLNLLHHSRLQMSQAKVQATYGKRKSSSALPAPCVAASAACFVLHQNTQKAIQARRHACSQCFVPVCNPSEFSACQQEAQACKEPSRLEANALDFGQIARRLQTMRHVLRSILPSRCRPAHETSRSFPCWRFFQCFDWPHCSEASTLARWPPCRHWHALWKGLVLQNCQIPFKLGSVN